MRSGELVRTRRQSGFALMALLLIVAVSGLALASAAQLWSTASRRDKEEELLHIGREIRQAIRSYALSSPGGQRYPQRLEDLVLDPRFPFVKRHLRRIYADPLTGEPEWGLVMAGDSIIGVHSLARGKPLKTTLDPELGIADDAQTYEQWIFAVPAEVTTDVNDDEPSALQPGADPLPPVDEPNAHATEH